MPLQCNINTRGKLLRLIYGVALVVAGVVLLFIWLTMVGRIVEAILILVGSFAIFEARKGWCVIRAMGGKTPI